MVSKDYIVIGGGIVGVSAALALAKEGREVLLIERDKIGAPNPISSSGDYSKVFRHAYGSDRLMTKLCAESLKIWREIEAVSGRKLYTRCGVLGLGMGEHSWARDSAKTLEESKLGCDFLGQDQICRRYPLAKNNFYDHAVLDHEAGMLKAQLAVRTIGLLAKARGVEVWEDTGVEKPGNTTQTGRGPVVAKKAIILAAGYSNAHLFSDLESKTFITRQQTVYLKPKNSKRFSPERFPVLVSFREGFYVLPLHDTGAVKISNHNKAEVIKGTVFKENVEQKFIDGCYDFLNIYIPELAESKVLESRVCLYTNTVNEDFIIDRVGNVVIASPCSGHGFKMGPLTGQMAAELAMGKTPRHWDARFALNAHAAVA